MRGLRHTDEWLGLLVIAALVVLLVAILQAGFLRAWFAPTAELRLILPVAGVGGLEAGADVEVLGTKAGTVERIVIDPKQQMNAFIRLDEQAKAFIRRDSVAVIRRRFGVAGAAYVDISRGTTEEMDWSYAVIEATTERAPTDSISALIDEVRQKVFPILDNTGRATEALAEIIERVNRGEGNLGQLLVDEALMQQVEATVGTAADAVISLHALMDQLESAAGDVRNLTGKLGAPDGVPSVIAKSNVAAERAGDMLVRADEVLATLQGVLGSVEQAAKSTPAIARNLEGSTANLPALLTQLQVTLAQLDQLIVQMRGSWLLGGGGGAAPQPPKQFSPSQVLP